MAETVYAQGVLKRCLISEIDTNHDDGLAPLETAINGQLLSCFQAGRNILDILFEYAADFYRMTLIQYEVKDYTGHHSKPSLIRNKYFIKVFDWDAAPAPALAAGQFLIDLSFNGYDVYKVFKQYIEDVGSDIVIVVYFQAYYNDFLEATET